MIYRVRPVWRMLVKKTGTSRLPLSLDVSANLIHKQTGLRIKAPLSLSLRGNLRFVGKEVSSDTVVILDFPETVNRRNKTRDTIPRRAKTTNTIQVVFGEDVSYGFYIPDS